MVVAFVNTCLEEEQNHEKPVRIVCVSPHVWRFTHYCSLLHLCLFAFCYFLF